jgi:hypothetical protein
MMILGYCFAAGAICVWKIGKDKKREQAKTQSQK